MRKLTLKKKRTEPERRTQGDERVKRSRRAVLEATYELLQKAGLSGASVDEVCRRSGVAKTTIYRHWASREALLLDACSTMGPKSQAPDTGNPKRDLETLVTQIAHRLQTAPWAKVLPSIIDAAERDRHLAGVQARIHAEMRSPVRTILERAQQNGELPKSLDPAHLVAHILGPLFYRRWFSREALDARFLAGVVSRAMTEAVKKVD
jgi:AcrR family transcriptional regulator